MNIGVCSVVLGLFVVGINNSQIVWADTVNESTVTTVEKRVEKSPNIVAVTTEANKPFSTNEDVSNNKKTYGNIENNETEAKDKLFNQSLDARQSQESNTEQDRHSIVETNTYSTRSLKLDTSSTDTLLVSKKQNSSTPSNGWESHNSKLYYRNSDEKYLRNQWAAPTGTIHYFGKEGYTISNQWYTMINNQTYYFDQYGHTVKNRWYNITT